MFLDKLTQTLPIQCESAWVILTPYTLRIVQNIKDIITVVQAKGQLRDVPSISAIVKQLKTNASIFVQILVTTSALRSNCSPGVTRQHRLVCSAFPVPGIDGDQPPCFCNWDSPGQPARINYFLKVITNVISSVDLSEAATCLKRSERKVKRRLRWAAELHATSSRKLTSWGFRRTNRSAEAIG